MTMTQRQATPTLPTPQPARRRRPRLPRALLLALSAGALLLGPRVAVAVEPDGWVRVETDHFTFFGDGEETTVAGVATDLERMRQALVQIAPSGRFESHSPIRLYLFSDAAGLAPFLPGTDPVGAGESYDLLSAPGVLVAHEHGVYGASLRVGEGAGASRYVYKQYLHWVLQTNLPELPLWLRQGLAELYSNFEVTETEARIGLPIEAHIRYLRRAAQTPVPGIVGGADPAARIELPPAREGVFELEDLLPQAHYPELWALVHYLVIGNDETREEVPGYLHRLVAGDEPEAAFRAAFGRSREELVADLDDYVRAESWRFARYPLRSLGPVAVTVERLAPAEVEYRLGDLLVHTRPDRAQAAAAHFERALELDADHGLAAAGLGWLAHLEGRSEEALAHYRRAVDRAPGEPLVQYLYGDALLAGLGRRRPATEDELDTLRAAEAALGKATELAPASPEAWARLGLALNLEPEGSQRAVATLERAAQLLPSRMDVANHLLLAYARVGDVAAADRLLASMPARGADREALAQAREIRLQLAFAEVNALTRRGELDDAVAVLAQIRAETRSPATAERADKQLELVATAAEHNRFAARFQEAVERIDAGDPAAAEALAALGEIVRPGRQTELYGTLRERLSERLESRPSQADSSGEPTAAAVPR